MAKLVGYSERLAFDHYDAFSPRDFPGDRMITLFSGRAADRSTTLVVRDMCARTNLSLLPDHVAWSAWHAWASVTTVSLVVGCRTAITFPLSDIFMRRLKTVPTPMMRDKASVDDLADRLRFAHDPTLDEHERWAISSGLTSISEKERTGWLASASEAIHALNAPAYACIPERQNYWVAVATDERALAAMLEVMPTNVAPQALVWVHLAGFSVMNVDYDEPAQI